MTYEFNEFQTKWLEALESGEYKQAQNTLFNGEGYCCIGVGFVATGRDFVHDGGCSWSIDGESAVASPSLAAELKLHGIRGETNGSFVINGEHYASLTQANDHGQSFADIASAIRSNPTAVFKE